MVTYQWQISDLEIHPEEEGYTDVVYTAHWRLNGFKEEEGTMYSSGVYGSVGIPLPGGPTFTPFQDLKEEEVVSWVQNSLGPEQVAQYEATIAANIEDQIHPKSITLPPPWLNPAPAAE